MDLKLTDEQDSVRTAFADFFAKEATPERLRKSEPLGFDAELWRALAGTGAVTMGVAEELGGDGASWVDLALVAREAGRRLAPVPFVEAVAAVDALSRSPFIGELLPEIAAGTLLPSLALAPADASGTARLVPAGAVADLLVVLDGDELVAIRRADRPEAGPQNLGSVPLADWDLRAAGQERQVVAVGAQARASYGRAVTAWRLLTGAALTGLGAQALDMAVAYVKTRHAFGVPIGSFQTIAHRLADVAAVADAVALLVDEAAWAADEDPARAESLATMAFLAAADSSFRTCRESLQFHGGYGYTLEYDIQLYFRRAKAWPLAIGPLRDQYQLLADQLFADPAAAGSSSEMVN